jgi:hypothetical protein
MPTWTSTASPWRPARTAGSRTNTATTESGPPRQATVSGERFGHPARGIGTGGGTRGGEVTHGLGDGMGRERTCRSAAYRSSKCFLNRVSQVRFLPGALQGGTPGCESSAPPSHIGSPRSIKGGREIRRRVPPVQAPVDSEPAEGSRTGGGTRGGEVTHGLGDGMGRE